MRGLARGAVRGVAPHGLCAVLAWVTLAALGVLEQRAFGKREQKPRSFDSHDAPAQSGAG